MERIERFRNKREKTSESFVSLADALNDLETDDFESTDNSETSADIMEAITIANERIGSRVHFGSVRVQTHKVVLGDVSACLVWRSLLLHGPPAD